MDQIAAAALPRRLFHYNGGFLWDRRLRRILELAGHELRLGWPGVGPGPGDGIIVWGKSPFAARGEAVAKRVGAPLIRAEDAFLRSIRPGRMGDPPMGIQLDAQGIHFDASGPSRLETILNTDALDNPDLLARARLGLDRMQRLDLSKYNMHHPDLPPPGPGFILLVDQLRGDASLNGAGRAAFLRLLARARQNHPGKPIVLKQHPETLTGLRPGHFGPEDLGPGVTILREPVSPWRLLEAADAVYTHSSQLGFEAILAGHRPIIGGTPFYAGWGLSEDLIPLPRRGRARSPEQLFAAAMILAPLWYDPCRDRLCPFEAALDQMEAELRAHREDNRGHIALGMRLWKRRHLQAFFGRDVPLRFRDDPALARQEATNRKADLLVWAGREPHGLNDPPPAAPVTLRRVEDGFLRSRGLGADLIPPLSLVTDDLGIYYDPGRPSRLETLIRTQLPPGGAARVEALTARIIDMELSKYNLDARDHLTIPQGYRILVPGQVEDDASIRLGAGTVRTNLALLRAARTANPGAVLIYKPHPDVEAGLRPGRLSPAESAGLADLVAEHASPIALIKAVDEVWTMTSLLGFEALLRGRKVTCLGAPFYAGWGLTTDLAPIPARRAGPPVPLPHLVHAALIGYPRYHDPITNRPCPPELAIERLANALIPPPTRANRILAKLQGRLASHAALWRRRL